MLALAVQGPPQAASTAGSLAGCASDRLMQRLPGVFVVATAGRLKRTTTADAAGCYELKDLPPGSYRVTALLTGFDNVTRDAVTIARTGAARLDFVMQASPMCECVRVGGTTLADRWDYADAVLHVRLSASGPQPKTPEGYYRHAATVLHVVKKPVGPLPAHVFVLQNQRSGSAAPYDIGQELVIFLKPQGPDGFAIANDEPGLAAIVFLVKDDRIQRAPEEFAPYVGMRLDAFFLELRALSRGK